MPVKTLEGFDFPFQPLLDQERIAAPAQPDFIRNTGVVHLQGLPGTCPLPSAAQSSSSNR
ncbi:hypothetical protein [Leisingera methylohalidivorans]|uniref:hypothetical protein n=1 Tax=Leisingera methylohalidivorans TaxID=133924 RepID=UPI0024811243|nr:hypothetical protein [Leisingera methylohalidivorans]